MSKKNIIKNIDISKKKKILILISIIILSVIILWVTGVVPKQIGKITATNYVKTNYSNMNLIFDKMEYSKYHDEYFAIFRDNDDNIYNFFLVASKFLPLKIKFDPIKPLFDDYNFTGEFSQLNQEFNNKIYSNLKSVSGMSIAVQGYINGKGTLSVIHQPFEANNGIIFELEGNINVMRKNTDWYSPEILLKYIPENESVEGKLVVKIKMY